MVYTGNPFFQMLFTLCRYSLLPYSLEYMYNTTSPQLEKTNSTITATVNFYQIASCLSDERICSAVYFQQPIVDLLPGSATNAIDASHWTEFAAVTASCEYLQTL